MKTLMNLIKGIAGLIVGIIALIIGVMVAVIWFAFSGFVVLGTIGVAIIAGITCEFGKNKPKRGD